MLRRRSPLKRKTPLRRVSKKRASEARQRIAVRHQVFLRDGWTCRAKDLGLGPCEGVLTFGHVKKASQGGKFSVDNGAAVCLRHNLLQESTADAAIVMHEAGLLRYSWEDAC